MRQATLRLDGMICDGRVSAVDRALMRVNGISEVSLLLGCEARVVDDEARASRDALLDVVREAGYCAAGDRDVHRSRSGAGHVCRG